MLDASTEYIASTVALVDALAGYAVNSPVKNLARTLECCGLRQRYEKKRWKNKFLKKPPLKHVVWRSMQCMRAVLATWDCPWVLPKSAQFYSARHSVSTQKNRDG